jgi:DNA-binding NarL/FixJ family response regulator
MNALVIDDHPVFVSALVGILEGMPQRIQAQSAHSIEEALSKIEANPDLSFILLDLGLPGLDGLSFLRILEKRRLTVPVIVISSQEEPESIRGCVDAGAIGFIPKSHSPKQVREAIEHMLRGEIYLPPQALAEQTVSNPCPASTAPLPGPCASLGLTQRSYQVLCCLAEGRTNKEIANRLEISVHTVKAHLARLTECLHTNNRTDTVQEAIRLGLIKR